MVSPLVEFKSPFMDALVAQSVQDLIKKNMIG